MVILKLFWLGPPTIEYDGRPLKLEMRKPLALLAYLSLSPQSPTRETLASLFWPEHDQQHALSSLRRSLFSLGKSLPPGYLEADREKIGLRRENGLMVDVEEFRAHLVLARQHPHPPHQVCPDCLSSLEKAAAIYKGDFFEGFNLKDCPGFDEWQFFQRERLRSEYADVLEKLAAYYQDRCEWEKAITVVRSWLALDRLNEFAQRKLIGLYIQSGQRRLALRQYEVLIDLLQKELGQAPEAETSLSLPESAGKRAIWQCRKRINVFSFPFSGGRTAHHDQAVYSPFTFGQGSSPTVVGAARCRFSTTPDSRLRSSRVRKNDSPGQLGRTYQVTNRLVFHRRGG